MKLNIAPNFGFPLEVVTETIAILAKRGSGKTYCAAVLVEEMVKAGLPVAVVDPIGVWWVCVRAPTVIHPACRSSSSAATAPICR